MSILWSYTLVSVSQIRKYLIFWHISIKILSVSGLWNECANDCVYFEERTTTDLEEIASFVEEELLTDCKTSAKCYFNKLLVYLQTFQCIDLWEKTLFVNLNQLRCSSAVNTAAVCVYIVLNLTSFSLSDTLTWILLSVSICREKYKADKY